MTPGRPAGKQDTPVLHVELHNHTVLDGKRIAHNVTRHQVADARFKRSLGGTDNYGRRAHPGSEVMDA